MAILKQRYIPEREKEIQGAHSLYDFMEANKVNGSVSTKKLGSYLKATDSKAYKSSMGHFGLASEKAYVITNKNKTLIANMLINNKNKRVYWWAIR